MEAIFRVKMDDDWSLGGKDCLISVVAPRLRLDLTGSIKDEPLDEFGAFFPGRIGVGLLSRAKSASRKVIYSVYVGLERNRLTRRQLI